MTNPLPDHRVPHIRRTVGTLALYLRDEELHLIRRADVPLEDQLVLQGTVAVNPRPGVDADAPGGLDDVSADGARYDESATDEDNADNHPDEEVLARAIF